jgi:hypothetical protein
MVTFQAVAGTTARRQPCVGRNRPHATIDRHSVFRDDIRRSIIDRTYVY